MSSVILSLLLEIRDGDDDDDNGDGDNYDVNGNVSAVLTASLSARCGPPQIAMEKNATR
jgi:hypothetical protein